MPRSLPRTIESRTEQIHLRVSPREKALLRERALREDITEADVLRTAVFAEETAPRQNPARRNPFLARQQRNARGT